MKSDLDRLMQERGLDAVVVVCDGNFSPARDYLTGGVAITSGLVIKPHGSTPVIVANPMEIEEAGKTGLRVVSFNDVGWPQMLKDAGGDRVKAEVAFWRRALEMVGVERGKVGIYGVSDVNIGLELVRLLAEAHPQYTFAGEVGLTLFDEAFVTKDADELARLRVVGRKTADVLALTWDYLRGARLDGDALLHEDGTPFLIGDVKRFVRRALLDRDLEEHGVIFAQGRDGGFPHSRGEADQQLRRGQAIVFDLFPHEAGGGYYHDVTRTWCLGDAPAEVRQAHEQVMEAFDLAVEVFRAGMKAAELQEAVQTYFEERGHATTRSNPSTMDGYVHSLGHGVGMVIHERPSLSHMSPDVLQPGNVISIEPGLYYPERGFGVRIEDTFLVTPDGALDSLTPFRKDLVIPLG